MISPKSLRPYTIARATPVCCLEECPADRAREHLIPTVLRIEQALGRILELNESLTALESVYATAPEANSKMDKERLTDKRDELAEITDAKNGDIVRARDALVRLIDILEKDREPGLEAAREARKRLNELERSMRMFRDRIGPGIICYSLLGYLAAIEMHQRQLTHTLNRLSNSPYYGPVRILDGSKAK